MATSIIKTDRFTRNTTNLLRVASRGTTLTVTGSYSEYSPVLVFGIVASAICVFMVFPWATDIYFLYNPTGITLTKSSGSTYTISASSSGGWDAVVVGGFTSASVS